MKILNVWSKFQLNLKEKDYAIWVVTIMYMYLHLWNEYIIKDMQKKKKLSLYFIKTYVNIVNCVEELNIKYKCYTLCITKNECLK